MNVHLRKLQQAKLATIQCEVVMQPAEVGAADTPVWVQVARAGEFNGYNGGAMSFTFDAETFQKVIANFRNHPSYRAGGNGEGEADVVAWDFHHASEMPATDGTIPFTGAPAQGWIRELQMRQGQTGIELWALTNWLEPARTFVKEGKYKWASVSVVFDATDPVSGENVGPVLTSVALTNQPFIEGMQPLVASKNASAQLRRYYGDMYVEPADSAEDALNTIRRMLGMPETADAVAVAAELEKVKQWIASGTVPMGVDLDAIVGALRTVLNLPALSSTEEVMLETDKLIMSLQEPEPGMTEPPAGGEGLPAQPPVPPANFSKETTKMLKVIADKLGVIESEEAVLEAVGQLIELRNISASQAGLEATASTKVICKATLDNDGVRAKYVPLLQALGMEDPDAALDKVASLMQESEQLKQVAPELAALKARVAEIDQAEADEDVEEAMASMNIQRDSANYEGLKLAVSHYRSTHTREEFQQRYPKPAASQAHLTQKISAPAPGAPAPAAAPTPAPAGSIVADQVDISHMPGVNLQMKAQAYVREEAVKSGVTLAHDDVCERASLLCRSKKVTATL